MDNFDEFGGLPGYGAEWFRYAVCFCGTKDLLSQWERYTPSGGGVALSISVPALQKYAGQEFALIRMLYDVHHQTQLVNHLVNYALGLWEDFRPESHEEANDFLGHLGYIVIQSLLRFKHPAFAQEDEWRVLLITWAREIEAVRNREKEGKRIPYFEWRFRPEYLDGILIGPGPYAMDEAIPRDILTAHGLGYVPIERSEIPLG